MSVELGLTADRRWNVEVAAVANAARQAGFSTVGLGAEYVDDQAAATLRAKALRCHELMALVISNNTPATIASAERLAVKAAAIGAPWIVTVFTATMNRDAMALVARCAEMFAAAGARMAVEFSPLGTVTSIRDGLQVAESAGGERAALLIDSWHFFRGDSTWEDLEEVPLERIGYVQFDDALPPISDDGMDETMNRRAMPGEGMFDLERFASTLLDRGWTGVVSVEILNRDLATLPVSDFARMAYQSTSRYWL